MQWILGLDIGTKKTGIAIGQTITASARPLQLLKKPIDELNAEDFQEIVREWKINQIAIGLPRTADGKDTQLMQKIRKIAADIENKLNIPVNLIDETLTSNEARNQFGKRKEYDSAAAVLIAESFMAENGW